MKFNQLTLAYMNTRTPGYVSKDQKPNDLTKYLRLDLGENLLGCSPKVISCVKNISPEDLHYYTDPSNSAIKNTISLLYGIQKDNVTLANSSNEIIDYLPKMILEPKDKVLIVTPTFFRYIESSLSAEGSVSYLALQEKDGYVYTDTFVDTIIDRVNRLRIKLIWLCNPNNPTGIVLDIEHIERIVKQTRAVIILDEAFYEFYDLSNDNSGIRLIEKYKNIIVLRTLSKAYGLAGLRLGYAIAHRDIIELIEQYRNTLVMTSSVVQKIAIAALQDQQWLMHTVSKTKKLRKYIEMNIPKIHGLCLIKGSEANIYLLRHERVDIYENLKKEGVITADFRQSKGLEGKRYVRITIGDRYANRALVSILKKYE